MNPEIQKLIDGIGAFTEMWHVAYQNFIKLGYSTNDALVHTSAFVQTIVNSLKEGMK